MDKNKKIMNFKLLISMLLLLSMICLCGCDLQSAEGTNTAPSSEISDTVSDKLGTSALPSGVSGDSPIPTLSETPTETPSETPYVIPSETPYETPSETPFPVTPYPSVSETPSSEDPSNEDEYNKRSLLGLLKTGIMPMGSTSYVWGGGWNKENTGAGKEAVTLGLSSRWAEFSALQDKDYDFHKTMYQIHDGLDCSGYVGWVLYNTFESEDGKDGYVMKSSRMAESFSLRGFGDYTPAEEVHDWQAGDLMSKNGHVWLAVGMCDDGSVVMMHCTPPGVVLSGTRLADGSDSLAVALAEKYMSEYFPQWYEKYPSCGKDCITLTQSSRMRWNRETLSDDEGLSLMTAEKVLALIFDE